ncbi:hypothetical protein J6590_046401 [Homalodisca vitripennis]|nr:hypothetical protein J6590_046401 [Homalodisca vitripennis]
MAIPFQLYSVDGQPRLWAMSGTVRAGVCPQLLLGDRWAQRLASENFTRDHSDDRYGALLLCSTLNKWRGRGVGIFIT